MGYRSDVTALIYPSSGEHSLLNYERLKLLMNTTFKQMLDDWGDSFSWDDRTRLLEFRATDVKWYAGYGDMDAFSQFLSEIRDLEYEYEFMRIGEDYTDIEQDYTGDCNGYLTLSRTAEVNA